VTDNCGVMKLGIPWDNNGKSVPLRSRPGDLTVAGAENGGMRRPSPGGILLVNCSKLLA